MAGRPGEPPIIVITELKLSFTLELVLQAVDRVRAADQVYLAVAGRRHGRDQDVRVHRLCRLLGLGLLTVDVKDSTVAIIIEPMQYRPRPDLPKRKRLLAEHDGRVGDPALGGSTRRPIMTAYRQRALRCAAAMAEGARRPCDLRPLAEDAGVILLRNVYGWFERVCPRALSANAGRPGRREAICGKLRRRFANLLEALVRHTRSWACDAL